MDELERKIEQALNDIPAMLLDGSYVHSQLQYPV